MKKILGLFLFVFIMVVGVFALAQSASPTPPVGDVVAAAPVVPQWLLDLVSKFPKMSELLFIVGALRLTLKPLFAFMHQFFQSWGLVAFDQKELAVEKSAPMKAVFFLLDYVGSIKMPVQIDNSSSAPSQKSA